MTRQGIKARYVVGIDPGVETGFALYDRTMRRLAEVKTSDFWSVFDEVRARFSPDEAEVVVECPGLNARVVYARLGGVQCAPRRERIAGNVGSNRREAVLMVEGFRRLGYRVREERPTAAKWTQEQFARYTGYGKRASQHGRDAARLAFGL